MLRATEQLTWSATLEKFARGCQQAIDIALGRSADGTGRDNVNWQHFGGMNLRCKVLFAQPSDKQWPSLGRREQSSSASALALSQGGDRQMRIVVECGSTDPSGEVSGSNGHGPKTHVSPAGTTNSEGRSSGSSQPLGPMTLVDVDLVRINQAYFHTKWRLSAVEVVHQGLLVAVRYLDEHDASKIYRMQLVFKEEKDKDSFLTLIRPDVSIRVPIPNATANSISIKAEIKPKQDAPAIEAIEKPEVAPSATAAEGSQPDSQSLLEQLVEMATVRVRQRLLETGTVPNAATATSLPNTQQIFSVGSSLPQAQGSEHPSNSSESRSSVVHSSLNLVTADGQAQPGTPSTEFSFGDLLSEVDSEEEEGEMFERLEQQEVEEEEEEPEELEEPEGLYGWPTPSAVQAIQHDVRLLCLTDPNLDWTIARCVDEYLRDAQSQEYSYNDSQNSHSSHRSAAYQ